MSKKISLIGERYGKLVVISEVPFEGKGTKWLCECDCGNFTEVRGQHLRSGATKSCGCYRSKDLRGQKFGRLTPIEIYKRAGVDGEHTSWICQCECGNTTIAKSNDLQNLHTISCGCAVGVGINIDDLPEEHRIKLARQRKRTQNYYRKNFESRSRYYKDFRKHNRQLLAERNKRYRLANKDKVIAMAQTRRNREASVIADFTTKEWEECLKHFDYKCAYCGSSENITQDHFIPLSKGGGYTKSNIVPACNSCNCSKQARDFDKWFIKQESYTKEREEFVLDYINSFKGVTING